MYCRAYCTLSYGAITRYYITQWYSKLIVLYVLLCTEGMCNASHDTPSGSLHCICIAVEYCTASLRLLYQWSALLYSVQVLRCNIFGVLHE